MYADIFGQEGTLSVYVLLYRCNITLEVANQSEIQVPTEEF